MEDKQKLGLKIGVTSLLFLVVILGVYFVNDLTQDGSQSLTTKAAQVSSNLTIVSPKSGETLKGKSFFEARLQTQKDIKRLKGVFKIGDGPTLPLSLKKVDASSISASADINTSADLEGQYFVKVYIYEASGSAVSVIATADFPVLLDNR